MQSPKRDMEIKPIGYSYTGNTAIFQKIIQTKRSIIGIKKMKKELKERRTLNLLFLNPHQIKF